MAFEIDQKPRCQVGKITGFALCLRGLAKDFQRMFIAPDPPGQRQQRLGLHYGDGFPGGCVRRDGVDKGQGLQPLGRVGKIGKRDQRQQQQVHR